MDGHTFVDSTSMLRPPVCQTVPGAFMGLTFLLGRQMRNVMSKSCEERLDVKEKGRQDSGGCVYTVR